MDLANVALSINFMQVVINSIITNYEKQGEGPVILFLHGWGDDSRTFGQMIAQLSKKYSCIALDLPGFGASNLPLETWGVEDFANFVAAFANKLAVKPVAIVGHSNGGTIAMFTAAHKLLKVEQLVLVASAGIRSEEALKKNLYKVVAKTGKQVTRFLPKNMQQKLRKKLYAKAGSDLFVSPHLEETFKKVVSYDIEADAAKIMLPTLLIYAADDTATPARYGEKLHAAIKNSDLKILPSGGHFVHQTQTDEVAQLMKDFLK